MLIRLTILLFAYCILLSCSKKTDTSSVLTRHIQLKESSFTVDKDNLAQIEGIQCNDSILITWDFHSGESFTLFNTLTGNCYGRFGTIGQGPTEVPLGSGGYIEDNQYKIFECSIGYIGQYNLDSLCRDIKYPPQTLSRRTFNEDFFFSAIFPINDTLYFGAGLCNSKDQYALFDNKNNIIHSNILVYNAFNPGFEKWHKILSNQGRMTKSPIATKFAFFLNNSSNIDFIEVTGNKINAIKLLREKDPMYTPIQNGTMRAVYPDRNAPIGYIDITSGEKYVYALYTDKPFDQSRSSDIIYVYDWQGNLTKQYKLTREAHYITVNETTNQLYCAVKEEDGGWNIISYIIE